MKNFRVDASLICFALVILAAIPVASLRSKTFVLGYELGKLKSEERVLRQENAELQSELASLQRQIRDKHLGKNAKSQPKLTLPSPHQVMHSQSQEE